MKQLEGLVDQKSVTEEQIVLGLLYEQQDNRAASSHPTSPHCTKNG